ncbi:MAG: hypothetical protein LOY00_08150, partial [Methylocaldum sp.]|nr:hypothetical protein [Methylocaldum sp.]
LLRREMLPNWLRAKMNKSANSKATVAPHKKNRKRAEDVTNQLEVNAPGGESAQANRRKSKENPCLVLKGFFDGFSLETRDLGLEAPP